MKYHVIYRCPFGDLTTKGFPSRYEAMGFVDKFEIRYYILINGEIIKECR